MKHREPFWTLIAAFLGTCLLGLSSNAHAQTPSTATCYPRMVGGSATSEGWAIFRKPTDDGTRYGCAWWKCGDGTTWMRVSDGTISLENLAARMATIGKAPDALVAAHASDKRNTTLPLSDPRFNDIRVACSAEAAK